ncbi:MAG: hypothetical protein ACSLFQ_07790 [Thermoanaerobaculia bacterium]
MSEQQLQQARRAQATQSGTQLNSKELAEVIQEASRRQGEAIKNGDAGRDLASVNDAYAVAEELGIPVEHVRAALASRESRKAKSAVPGTIVFAIAGAALTGGALILVGLPVFVGVAGGIGAGMVIAIAGFIAGAMKRNPEKLSGPAPVPGTCRVCFRPAHSSESTFCEEHRYKGLGQAKP